ncbi:hypothetical protein Dimus_004649 [Dionaea muscipula]
MEFTGSTSSVTILEQPQSDNQDQGSASGVESGTSIDVQFQNLSVEQRKICSSDSNGVEEIKFQERIEIVSCNGADNGNHDSGKNGSNEEEGDGGEESTGEKEEEGVNDVRNENESGEVKEREEKGVVEVEKSTGSQYPVRPQCEDCSFYLRTGTCKFGIYCKFNHPPTNKISVNNVKEKDEQSERASQVYCKYYDRPGGCKFGKACKFIHDNKTTAAPSVELNFMGLPIRPGEKECPYYMRKGSCKYGAYCRFHHPEPTAVGGSGIINGGLMEAKSASLPSLPRSLPADSEGTVSYVPLFFPPTQDVPSSPNWSTYQAPVYVPERSPLLPPPQVANYFPKDNIFAQQRQQMTDEFPDRPGQPECSYFLKTGNCKYRSACKFHHPKSRNANGPSCALSALGLPLRPGQNICSHYSRYGICKFGPECKYDHPENNGAVAPLMPRLDQPPSFGICTGSEVMMVGTGNGS